MTARVAHRLARTAAPAAYSRCPIPLELAPGDWCAVECDALAQTVCDRCTACEEPHRWRSVEALQSMAVGVIAGRTCLGPDRATEGEP